MLNPNQEAVLKGLDFKPESQEFNWPIRIQASFPLDSMADLLDAVEGAMQQRTLTEEQAARALRFIDDIRLSGVAEAVIAELPRIEDGSLMYVDLVFPRHNDGNT